MKNKTPVSKSVSYKEIGEFWDKHNLSDYWGQTRAVNDVGVDIQSEVTYYPVDNELAGRIRALAKKRGISADTLLNLWLQEKIKKMAL